MNKRFIRDVLTIHFAIVTAGLILDEAGNGTFGESVQQLANKVTRGFGV